MVVVQGHASLQLCPALFMEDFFLTTPCILYSSYRLHWLSQVPSGLVTEEGLPLNKGNIYIGKTSPKSVHDAYLDQFDRDFTNFLSIRADELVSGGHLFVTLTPKIDDPVAYNVQDLLGMTMNDMVSEGLIEEKALDTFNLPHYRPSLEEVKAIIEKNRALKIRYLDNIQLRVIGVEAAHCGKGAGRATYSIQTPMPSTWLGA